MTESKEETATLETLLEEIDELIVEEQLDEAKGMIEEALKTQGDVEELLVLGAEVALESEDYEQCVRAADDAVERVDSDAARGQLLELRGYAQFYLDELESARASFNEAIRLRGASWTGLLGRSMVHEEMLYFRAVMLDLDRAIAMDDQEAQPFAIRGSIRLRYGQLEEAEADLAHAVSMDEEDEESRLNLARLQATSQKTSAAIETLEPLIEDGQEPELVLPALLLRSQLSLTLGSTEAAEEDAQRAVELAPQQPWGHLQLAASRLTAMKPGDAIEAIKAAESKVDDVREIPDAWPLRASAYDQLDKPEKAAEMRQQSEGVARLPGVVYGEWLNPARNVPINPNKPIDVRSLMAEIFEDPSQAPEGYEQALRGVLAQVPQMIEDNPESDKIRIRLPELEGAEEAPKSVVLQVKRPTKKGSEE